MKIRPVRHVVASLTLALLALLMVAGCGQEPKVFPHAFPESHTDVSAQQAFRDYGLDVPGSAKVVGYYAWSADDAYPMAAVLRMPCSSVSRFISGSGLQKASSADGETTAVEVFASDHGWTDDDKDERYLRTRGANEVLGALIHRTGRECTVYLAG